MIADYESERKSEEMCSPGIYGLSQNHKHLKEMTKIPGLTVPPVFCPIVDDYYKGMATTVPFQMCQLTGVTTVQEVWEKLSGYYAGQNMVSVAPLNDPAYPRLHGNVLAGKDTMLLVVEGNDERFTVTALFDNLGKGASGAAVQNMNIMLGLDEMTGLER